MNSRVKIAGFLGLSVLLFLAACLAIDSAWDFSIVAICVFYAIVVSIFLAAQVVGFVMSQTEYSESVEQPKFKMLVEEELEWAEK